MTGLLVTESGEEHGLVKTVANSVSEADGCKNMDAVTKAKYDKKKKEDAKMVKCRYINYRGSHERLDKPYCRYAGDPIRSYHLIPDHVYELPVGFIEEVNSSPGLARRSEVLDASGQPTKKDGKAERLHELVAIF